MRPDQSLGRAFECHLAARNGDPVSVFRNDGQAPYRVSVFPLKYNHAVHDSASACEAILFVEDPEQNSLPEQVHIRSHVFRLTPAEARLAVLLASSGSLKDAADLLSVNYNSARAHLRAIFDKTGTHRQTELIRVLQTSYSLRAFHSYSDPATRLFPPW